VSSHTGPLSDIQGVGRVWAVNVTGIIFNTEGNSADRKSQERNTMDFLSAPTSRENYTRGARPGAYESGGAATFLGTV
jgi:hypothetical protein